MDVQGYLTKARKRPEMFTSDQLTAIFGNIELIYAFASKLLADLEAKVASADDLHGTCIGDVFLTHVRISVTFICAINEVICDVVL